MSKYGRGKFDAHPNYIEYMESIVASEAFKDIPNAVSNGRINWQVSSGETTSFYKYYLARKEWWEKKADSLGLPGKENENERFTVTARIINPTGYRACRLCGENWNVGYFYINDRFLKRLTKVCQSGNFAKWQPVDSVIHELNKFLNPAQVEELFLKCFPERGKFFEIYGISKEAFEKSNYINSKAWLTPGFMGNPPDRLDGFHDYHFECRKNNDPGRFDANMQSYVHDRRSFEYWAEGNWMVTDTLYNLAGEGICLECPEDKGIIKRVSPDHIGPVSCGFKQIPFFKPLCSTHNSAKNRRFTYSDTLRLIDRENEIHESVASFQIQKHWDKYKLRVKNNDDSKLLSNSLRSLQDAYFRILILLWENGYVRFICTLLSPQYAFDNVTFNDLNASNLTYDSYLIERKITPNRKSLFNRSIRIALSSIQEYSAKRVIERKLLRKDFEVNKGLVDELLANFSLHEKNELDEIWKNELPYDVGINISYEDTISRLTGSIQVPKLTDDDLKFQFLKSCMDQIGLAADLSL